MPRNAFFLAVALLATASVAHAQNTFAATDGPCEESWFDHAVNCAPASPWEARVGAIFLRRSQLPQRVLAWNGTTIGNEEILTPLATTRDFNFGTQGGPEISLLRHGETADIEFRWFQIQDFVARTPGFVGGQGQGGFLLTDIGNDFIKTEGLTDFSAGYLSQLSSLELNARAPNQDGLFTPFCGFRYLEVNERLSETLFMPDFWLDDAHVSVRSFNSLYGFQIGSDAMLWNRGGPFRLAAVGKAGVYGNHATDRYRVFLEGQNLADANGTTNSAAFVGELGLVGTWQLTQRLAARIGYEILWVDGVAQAALQQTTSTDLRLFPVNTHGSAYYYGTQFGFDYRW